MRALWVTNAPIPRAAAALGVAETGFPTWIEASHHAMLSRGDVDVSVAFPSSAPPRSVNAGGSTFTTFPVIDHGRGREGLHTMMETIQRLEPDLVHVFGTESSHAHSAALACTRLGVPFVVGLQGLSATIAQHYLSGLPPSVAYGFTLRDALRRDSTARQAAKYRARGVSEASTLRLARYIIGRTTWDRAVSNQINPSARYFSVPETLRPGFYENHWSLRDCQPQTLFVSQGHYPIKGLHFVVQALRIIIDRHPDTQLFVGGRHPAPPGIRGRLKRTRYAAYLTHLIDHLGVADRVHFVGVLDENEMIQRYVRSNVFISASTVENESNSLSEAKLLGVPVIGSYVGGVVDRIEHGASGFLYQHDAPYMLAHYVSTLLTDTELSERFSARSRTESLALNDPRSNAQLLWDAYRTILRESDS